MIKAVFFLLVICIVFEAESSEQESSAEHVWEVLGRDAKANADHGGINPILDIIEDRMDQLEEYIDNEVQTDDYFPTKAEDNIVKKRKVDQSIKNNVDKSKSKDKLIVVYSEYEKVKEPVDYFPNNSDENDDSKINIESIEDAEESLRERLRLESDSAPRPHILDLVHSGPLTQVNVQPREVPVPTVSTLDVDEQVVKSPPTLNARDYYISQFYGMDSSDCFKKYLCEVASTNSLNRLLEEDALLSLIQSDEVVTEFLNQSTAIVEDPDLRPRRSAEEEEEVKGSEAVNGDMEELLEVAEVCGTIFPKCNVSRLDVLRAYAEQKAAFCQLPMPYQL